MKILVTSLLWIFGALLCIVASAAMTAGFWFTDREYIHLLDDCVYVHNFRAGGAAIPTFVVSATLIASSCLVWIVVTMVVNRCTQGSCLKISLRWYLVGCAFMAVGIAGWFAFAEWLSRAATEAFVRNIVVESVDIDAVDERQQ